MKYRALGRTGFNVSQISCGAWTIGGSWGEVSDADSLAALHRSIDLGVNFIDTADVYGDGRSERLIARLKSERREDDLYCDQSGTAALATLGRWVQPRESHHIRRAELEESEHRVD
jgi:aryl-alcohol dehydrogenase-like predicted oxidoreductase